MPNKQRTVSAGSIPAWARESFFVFGSWLGGGLAAGMGGPRHMLNSSGPPSGGLILTWTWRPFCAWHLEYVGPVG